VEYNIYIWKLVSHNNLLLAEVPSSEKIWLVKHYLNFIILNCFIASYLQSFSSHLELAITSVEKSLFLRKSLNLEAMKAGKGNFSTFSYVMPLSMTDWIERVLRDETPYTNKTKKLSSKFFSISMKIQYWSYHLKETFFSVTIKEK
jgi:hypothetical protein